MEAENIEELKTIIKIMPPPIPTNLNKKKIENPTVNVNLGFGAKNERESKKNLIKIPGIGPIIAENFDPVSLQLEAEKEMDFVAKNDITLLSYLDKSYPKRMLQIESCPLILYYKGSALLNHHRTVAVSYKHLTLPTSDIV